MPAPSRRSGRVTPKGTRPPGTTPADQRGDRPSRDRTDFRAARPATGRRPGAPPAKRTGHRGDR